MTMPQSRIIPLYVKRYSGICRKHLYREGSERTLCGAVVGKFSHIYTGSGPIEGTIVDCEKCAVQKLKLSRLEDRIRSKQ